MLAHKHKTTFIAKLLIAILLVLVLPTIVCAQSSGSGGGSGGGNNSSGSAANGDKDDSNKGDAGKIRGNYFKRFPVAREFGPTESGGHDQIKDKVSLGKDKAFVVVGTVGAPGQPPTGPVQVWPVYICCAKSNVPTFRDEGIRDDFFQTFGYPVSDTQFQIIGRYDDNRFLEQLFDPEKMVWMSTTMGQIQTTAVANSAANLSRNQASSAIEFNQHFLANFTVDEGNAWNKIRNQLFVPMAILLLLPGAVMAQVKVIIQQGSPVLGDAVNPFEGIIRSIIAIFFIPATYLVVNYGIDVSNSIAYTISSEYTRIFAGHNMYKDAACAEARSAQINTNPKNAITPQGAPSTASGASAGSQNVYSKTEKLDFDVTTDDPCNAWQDSGGAGHQDIKQEDHSFLVAANRALFYSANAGMTASWSVMCAFQEIYLQYLFLMGPIVAALWVWPMDTMRKALGGWVEGVITICFWSLFWNTTILLIACFRGVSDTGTIYISALNFLANISVRYAFDFASLSGQMGAQAGQKAGSAAKQAMAGGGGGKGSAAGAGAPGATPSSGKKDSSKHGGTSQGSATPSPVNAGNTPGTKGNKIGGGGSPPPPMPGMPAIPGLQPGPQSGSLQPGPQSGSLQPGPQSGSLQPGPQSGSLQPGPQSGSLQPGPQSGALQPGPQSGGLQPGPQSGSLQPGPQSGGLQPGPQSGGVQPGPQSGSISSFGTGGGSVTSGTSSPTTLHGGVTDSAASSSGSLTTHGQGNLESQRHGNEPPLSQVPTNAQNQNAHLQGHLDANVANPGGMPQASQAQHGDIAGLVPPAGQTGFATGISTDATTGHAGIPTTGPGSFALGAEQPGGHLSNQPPIAGQFTDASGVVHQGTGSFAQDASGVAHQTGGPVTHEGPPGHQIPHQPGDAASHGIPGAATPIHEPLHSGPQPGTVNMELGGSQQGYTPPSADSSYQGGVSYSAPSSSDSSAGSAPYIASSGSGDYQTQSPYPSASSGGGDYPTSTPYPSASSGGGDYPTSTPYPSASSGGGDNQTQSPYPSASSGGGDYPAPAPYQPGSSGGGDYPTQSYPTASNDQAPPPAPSDGGYSGYMASAGDSSSSAYSPPANDQQAPAGPSSYGHDQAPPIIPAVLPPSGSMPAPSAPSGKGGGQPAGPAPSQGAAPASTPSASDPWAAARDKMLAQSAGQSQGMTKEEWEEHLRKLAEMEEGGQGTKNA